MKLIKQTFKEYAEDEIPIRAAALAYFSVFSIAPLLVLIVWLLVFFGQTGAQAEILDRIAAVAGADTAATVRSMMEAQADDGAGTLATIVSVVVLLFAATTLFFHLKRTLNVIWNARPEAETTAGSIWIVVRARLMALLAVLSIAGLLLGALLLMTVMTEVWEALSDVIPGGATLWTVITRVFAFGIVVLVFALIFKVLPNATIPWRTVWLGATVTAALVVLATWGFGVYLSFVAVGSAYGAAGSLAVLLFWAFITSQVILLGAEFTQVYGRRTGARIEQASAAD
jgi:membrane protein